MWSPSWARAAGPKPPQLVQNASESASPTIPTTRRMTPAVWMLKPDEVVLTAQIKIAPAALSSNDKVIPMVGSFR